MRDVLGTAIRDYFQGRRGEKLWVHDEHGPNMEMPVKMYFRSEEEMPALEKTALDYCVGKVLDVGAGAGSHALALQQRGHEVIALDVSPGAVEVMRERGVKRPILQDIYDFKEEQVDTILLMMNGIGLSSTIKGLRRFLRHAETLLRPGGQLLFDSSDVAYLYDGTSFPVNRYYGEIKCRYEYKKKMSDWIIWLYVDQHFMTDIAKKMGWQVEILFEDEQQQYLARLQKSVGSD